MLLHDFHLILEVPPDVVSALVHECMADYDLTAQERLSCALGFTQ